MPLRGRIASPSRMDHKTIHKVKDDISENEEEKLFRVLRDNKEAFGWTIHDIKGLDPIICTHKINI